MKRELIIENFEYYANRNHLFNVLSDLIRNEVGKDWEYTQTYIFKNKSYSFDFDKYYKPLDQQLEYRKQIEKEIEVEREKFSKFIRLDKWYYSPNYDCGEFVSDIKRVMSSHTSKIFFEVHIKFKIDILSYGAQKLLIENNEIENLLKSGFEINEKIKEEFGHLLDAEELGLF